MHFEIDFLESHDTASVVAELQRIAALLGKGSVRAKDIDRHGRLNSRTVAQKFGTLRKAHEAAGLISARYTKSTEAELFCIIADLWTRTLRDHGRRPRAKEIEKYGYPVSSKTITVRFGNWKKALIATAKAVELPGWEKPAPPAKVVKQRQPLSERRRFSILKRDNYECRICHRSGVPLEVDHIVPVSLGGGDTQDNLQTTCKVCNRSKSDQLM